MNSKSDREELEGRLEQVRRLTDTGQDPLTRERLAALIAVIGFFGRRVHAATVQPLS